MILGSLNASQRAEDLDRLAGGEQVDMLVVGGGVTGAGVALDAASRGLSVALIESRDLAYGTSRWSSKLVHGGLRYLAKGDVALAQESAIERGILMTTTAPHLTRTVPQIIPLHTNVSTAMRAWIAAGLWAGDGLRRVARTSSDVLPAPHAVSTPEALALAPGLRADGLRGGLLAFDGALTDDARLVVTLARTAATFGARILTRVRASTAHRGGVLAVDERTGAEFSIRARSVVNATGVWAGELARSVRLRPSLGSHLVVSAEAAGVTKTAILVPIPGANNRFVVLLPQPDGRAYLGLTDEPADAAIPDIPIVPERDVDFLLNLVSPALRRPLTRADVVGRFAGVRPLIEAAEGAGKRLNGSADLSRKHAVLVDENGMVTVVGGKLTTYRKMAADAVDKALAVSGLSAGPARTKHLPLLGAAPRERLTKIDAPARLVAKYGTEAPRVAAIGQLDQQLARPLADGIDITAAEVVWAVRNEGALDVDDVLHRRTRLGLVARDADLARNAVTELVQKALHGVPSAS